MDLNLIWHKPVNLRAADPRSSMIYEIDLDKLPRKPGVYIFIRKFGENSRALYIGKANRLRTRIKQQLVALRLMKGIQNAAIGPRAVVFAEFVPKPGQQVNVCLPLIEKALIRHFLSDGHDLLNKAGTRVAKHSLHSKKVTGQMVPRRILFE